MRSFVGADAHIDPLKCCDFASDFRETGQFRRADRVVRPYGAKTKPNTITSIRPRAGVFPFWRVGRCGHRPLRRETENIAFCEAFCRGENETLYNNAHPPRAGVFPFWRVGRCRHRPLRRETGNAAVFRPAHDFPIPVAGADDPVRRFSMSRLPLPGHQVNFYTLPAFIFSRLLTYARCVL